ncbi:hypothetical protein OVA29_17610 [Exiguobacterium sp. SL14]|nr:hypothetical protein [Exiguobacterium sp. SL14]MCY1692179.1 hypothetical protein [Exiguobacterium sp. SL14]
MNEVRVWSEQAMGKGWKAVCHHQFDRHRLLIGEWFHNVGVLAFSINQDADLLLGCPSKHIRSAARLGTYATCH